MKKKEIKIRVVGTQIDEMGETNTIELTTDAKFFRKDKADYIVYEESQVSGMEGITTSLKIEGQRVSMVRFGGLNSNMVFDETSDHTLSYPTPYGEIDMVINTDKVDISIEKSITGSKISLDYRLTLVENMASTKNKLDISIIQ